MSRTIHESEHPTTTRFESWKSSRRDALQATILGGLAAVLGSGASPARANLPAGAPKRGYAQGPFGLVHYYDNGAAGRPLLMFHQAPMSARQFDRVYQPLARRGVRAIGIDMPGFGMSDPTDFVPRCEDWARIAPAVMDHLGFEQADVLGHHTGAMVATEVGLQFPQRVRNLVINGPFPLTESKRAKLLAGHKTSEIDFVYEPDGQHLAKAFMTRWRMYGPGADPKHITRYIVEKFQGFGPFWQGHYAAFQYDHEPALRKLQVRTLLLTNTGDQIYPEAQIARQIRPDFEYAELQGGGVDIVDQQPEEWAEAVAKFLGARSPAG
ncbi:MAG: alpha/beta hydrolase [Steroidobacteraceae bacterium]